MKIVTQIIKFFLDAIQPAFETGAVAARSACFYPAAGSAMRSVPKLWAAEARPKPTHVRRTKTVTEASSKSARARATIAVSESTHAGSAIAVTKTTHRGRTKPAAAGERMAEPAWAHGAVS